MQTVREFFDANIGRLDQAMVNFPWEHKSCYVRYLSETYRYIIHSTKLLEYAADKSKDPGLKSCLMSHVHDEKGHDNWALSDLKNLGASTEDSDELDETTSLYQTIYEGIEKHGPAPIIGYALALEGVSARTFPEISKRLHNTYGKKASVLITRHGEIDPGHHAEGFDVLKYLSAEEHEVVKKYMRESIDRYVSYLNKIAETEKAVAA